MTEKEPKDQNEIATIEAQLISMTESFLAELGRERAQRALNRDASLQRDLTIDSLGKVELFHRIEAFYEVELSENVMIAYLIVGPRAGTQPALGPETQNALTRTS